LQLLPKGVVDLLALLHFNWNKPAQSKFASCRSFLKAPAFLMFAFFFSSREQI